jgi:hypothetical protein
VRTAGAVAVEQPLGEREPVEGLVPELALRVRAEDAAAHPGHRRRDHHAAHEVGPGLGDALRRARADVVAAEHDGPPTAASTSAITSAAWPSTP